MAKNRCDNESWEVFVIRANLHLHSKFSDGTQWPEEIVARAKRFGLEMVALTDHDNLSGVQDFLECCAVMKLQGIAGVEMDCVAPEIHYDSELLAYFPRGVFPETAELLNRIITERKTKLFDYLAKAQALFHRGDLNFEELAVLKNGFSLPGNIADQISYTKVDLYNYLIKTQVIPASLPYREFKSQYQNTLFSRADGDKKPDFRELIRMIKGDAGLPVLPHPGHLFRDDPTLLSSSLDKLRAVFDYCREAGVWGVELNYYQDQTTEINQLIQKTALEYGFSLTYGSDCHGRGSAKDTMEKFWGDFQGLVS